MFETNDQARLDHLLQTNGTHRWAYIAQTSNHEWFFVTHEYQQEEDPEAWCQQQFMVPVVPYLLGLASTDTSEAFVREIQLVSPPWLNESDSWLMEHIESIRRIGNTYCYELTGGRVYPTEYRDRLNEAKPVWRREGSSGNE